MRAKVQLKCMRVKEQVHLQLNKDHKRNEMLKIQLRFNLK